MFGWVKVLMGKKHVVKVKLKDSVVVIKTDDKEFAERSFNDLLTIKIGELPFPAPDFSEGVLKELGETIKNAEPVKVSTVTEKKERPRVMSLVGSESRSTFSISDSKSGAALEDLKAKLNQDTITHVIETSRMTPDGVLVFRTRYECCNCGKKGIRYIQNTNKYTKCHDCDTKLYVQPSTREPAKYDHRVDAYIPAADRDGCHYRAKFPFIPKVGQ